MLKRISVSAAILAASVAVPGHAATLVSLDRDEFGLFSARLEVQDFDSFSAGSTLLDDGFISYSTTGGDPLVTSFFLPSTGSNGLGATDVGFFAPTDTLTLTFASEINAFGIDINTFATDDAAYRVVLSTGDDAFSVFDPFAGAGTGQFLGFVSDTPFTSLTLSAESGFAYTVDTLQSGAVPEPGTWALLLLGFFGIGAAMRRANATQSVSVSYS